MDINESKILTLLENAKKRGDGDKNPVEAVKNLMNAAKRFSKEASVHLNDTGSYVRPGLRKATENYLKKELSKKNGNEKILNDQDDVSVEPLKNKENIYQARNKIYEAFKLLDEIFHKMNDRLDKKDWLSDIAENTLDIVKEIQKFENSVN